MKPETTHLVTMTFLVSGAEEHAAKLAAKAEDAVTASKHARLLVEQADGSLVATDITEATR